MKKITRTIECVEYEVTLFNHDTDEVSKQPFRDLESLKENDIIRFLNAALKAKGDPRRVVKLVPIHGSSDVYEMGIDVFMKYAKKIEKRTPEQEEADS